jgi:hypothetical protein
MRGHGRQEERPRGKFLRVPKPPSLAWEENAVVVSWPLQGTGSATTSGLSTCGHDVLPGDGPWGSRKSVEALVPLTGTSQSKAAPTRFQGHFAEDRNKTNTKATEVAGSRGGAPTWSRSSKHKQPNT